MNKSTIFISCSKGIQPFLSKEISSLGFDTVIESVAGVETKGSLEDAMLLNLHLRTGHRVLYLLSMFQAETVDEFYNKLSEIKWEDYIPENGYLCVTSTVDTQCITDSRYANLKCKDAIVDRILKKCGRRPDSGPERDRAVVHIHWKGTACAVYFDTSGEPLSRRGYRKIPLNAPMQETLAAAIIMATGWKGEGNFINPMCGSGTLAIEAALIAINKAPGLLRGNYGFMHMKGFDTSSWKKLREKAKSMSAKKLPLRIIASDINPAAVEAARKNAQTAGVEHLIDFYCCDYKDTLIPDGGGVVIINPGYGERMGDIIGLEKTYKEIGDFFKKKCSGYMGYVFTGNLGLAKKIGLRSKKRMQFFNSNIECRLIEYELYKGSKKLAHQA